MAIKKVINVQVDTGNSEQELGKLEKSFKDVDQQAEKTDSQLQKVGDNGGAIAVLDSLTGGLATRVRDAAEASKLFNISLKGTRTALIATGIGAFVVALGLVVAYWDDIVDFITQANAKLENQLTLTKSIQGTLDAELATVNKQLELNKLQGKANEELERQKVAILERLREQNEAEVRILENQLERLKATSTEVGFWETIKANVAFTLFGTKALASESANLAAQRLAEINDLSAAIETAKLKEIDLAIQLYNAENPEAEEGEEGVDRPKGTILNVLNEEDIQLQLDSEKALQDASLAQLREFLIQQADIREAAWKNQSKTEIKWADLTAEAKLGIAQTVLGGVAGLVDEQSIAGKGIAIAQTGINTAQGIMQAFATLPTIPAIVAAALVGVTGILQTKKIATQKIPSATGSGFVGGGGGGGASPAAPAFNLVEGTSESQLNDTITNQNQQPIKANVVSGDVTTAQSQDRNIINESGI